MTEGRHANHWPLTTNPYFSKNRRLSALQALYYHCLTGIQQHKFKIILRVKLLIINEDCESELSQ